MIIYDFYDQRKYSIFGVKSSFPIMHIFLQIFFLIIKYQAKKGETLRITYQGGRKYHNLPQVMPLKSWTSIYIEVRDGIHTLLGLIVGGGHFPFYGFQCVAVVVPTSLPAWIFAAIAVFLRK